MNSLTLDTLPPEIRDASAWYGPELEGRTDWIEHLSAAEIAEVDSAAKELEQSSIDLTSISTDDAPLPTLGPRLRQLLEEVLSGRGFVLVKGLPIEHWTKREAAIAFLIIGVHLGRLRMQNAEGHLLGHVMDLGRSSMDPHTRIYQTRERQTHHTDSCDVVGLLCLRSAKSGGLSNLVSSTTIFNEMRRRRPDLVKVLFNSIETDRRGEVPEGEEPISPFQSSTGMKVCSRRSTRGNTSSQRDAFPASLRLLRNRSKHWICLTNLLTTRR